MLSAVAARELSNISFSMAAESDSQAVYRMCMLQKPWRYCGTEGCLLALTTTMMHGAKVGGGTAV